MNAAQFRHGVITEIIPKEIRLSGQADFLVVVARAVGEASCFLKHRSAWPQIKAVFQGALVLPAAALHPDEAVIAFLALVANIDELAFR